MTDLSRRISGIYGILPGGLNSAALLARAEAALAGGIKTLQLRDKGQGYKEMLKRGMALSGLTHNYGARFVMNDSLQLAIDCAADGVHLGREDMQSVAAIRAEVGDGMLIGISCQGDAAFAKHALNEGADYVSFGAVFKTASKQEAVPIGLPRLARARQMFPEANICAIGGIRLESLAATRQAGADCAAVIASLFGAENVEARARNMVEVWNNALSA